MTTEEAKKRVAGILAYNTYKAIEILKEIPNLAENTEITKKENREAAAALDLAAEYSHSCHIFQIGSYA